LKLVCFRLAGVDLRAAPSPTELQPIRRTLLQGFAQ